jgi:hypothetical protein
MRLLYQHIVQNITKDNCRVIINDLKGRVATSFNISERESQKNIVYRFLTTSRPVETWLQNVDDSIKLMNHKKVPFEFWVVTGGYGAGKSHMKEFLRRNKINNLEFLEPEISTILRSDESKVPIYDIFSFVLLQTRPFLDSLYDAIKKRLPFPSNGEVEEIKKRLRIYPIEDDFIDAFCVYARSGSGNRRDFHTLEELIIIKGEQLFLPLMKLYKKYLDINGLCIFIDEFESLQFLNPKTRAKFVQSIRPFYDTIASTSPSLPAFKMIILCTLSFWNDLTKDTYSQALETRIHLFEIPPLVEDEIVALAEKIYPIYKKSGHRAPEIPLEFNKLFAYLVQRAGIEAPLTPRFVINEIITIIEEPNAYLEFKPKA